MAQGDQAGIRPAAITQTQRSPVQAALGLCCQTSGQHPESATPVSLRR